MSSEIGPSYNEHQIEGFNRLIAWLSIAAVVGACIIVQYYGYDLQGFGHQALESIAHLDFPTIHVDGQQGLIKSLESNLNIPGGEDFFTHPIWNSAIDAVKSLVPADNPISNMTSGFLKSNLP